MKSVAGLLLAILVLSGCADASGPTADAQAQTPAASASPTAPAPSPGSADGPIYVALGDSYTAAPGVPETDDDTGCGRSSNNYPSLIAAERQLNLIDVSCSGADTLALVGTQQTSAGPIAPQLLAIPDDAALVTMGMGGNDEGLFRDLVTTCLSVAGEDPSGSPCRDAMAEADGGDLALDRVATIQTRLTSALTGIKDRAPQAQVVLVGYPQIVPAQGSCDILPLAAGDYAYIREVTVALGEATATAAADAGTEYADVLAASKGHDVCAGPAAWVNGIANSVGRAAAPLHPFAEGQVVVADLVLAALDD